MLLIPAVQMLAGRSAPVFPRWIADRPLPTKHLGAVVQRAISVLKYLEKVVRPRCPTPPELTKRVVGIFVVLLSARLLLMLIPLSNILPAVLIALISLGYLEEDGVLLSISLLAAIVVLALDLGLVWELLHGNRLLGNFMSLDASLVSKLGQGPLKPHYACVTVAANALREAAPGMDVA